MGRAKGRIPLPNLMIFWKNSKRPLTVSKRFFYFSYTIFPRCMYRACVRSLLCTKSPDDDMMTILWSCGTHTYRNTWQNVSAYRSKHKRAKDVLHSGLSTECKCIIILNKIRRQINLTCELLCTLYLMCVTRWTRLIVHEYFRNTFSRYESPKHNFIR